MSEESPAASEETANEEPKVRRISNKIPRKAAKETPRQESPAEDTPAPESGDREATPDARSEDVRQEPKRGNRRRRGKGKPADKDAAPPQEESKVAATADTGDDREKQPKLEQPRAPQKPRKRPDPDKVAKNAWKIYLAEVSEEGVALIGDNDARELARRCFRLAEIFLEEEDRRS